MILGTRDREAKIGLVADEQQLTLAHDRKQLILDRSVVSEELGGQYVDLYDFSDGELEVRWQEQLLPYRVFDKDQRVLTYRTLARPKGSSIRCHQEQEGMVTVQSIIVRSRNCFQP